jgi:hypothetical protein
MAVMPINNEGCKNRKAICKVNSRNAKGLPRDLYLSHEGSRVTPLAIPR